MTRITSSKHVILIVDDVPENLAMLSDALNEAGYMVLVATDGLSALERLGYATPDLILLDAVMPGLDGFETCRRIKLMRHAAHIPVVFMTGLTETEHVVNAFQVGGIDYVVKPIQPLQVLARIASHLRNASMISMAQAASDAAAHAVIVLDANGKPVWQTGKAQDWINRYFPTHVSDVNALPEKVRTWVERHIEELAGTDREVTPLMIGLGSRELEIRFSRGERSGDLLLVLNESVIAGAAPAMDNYQLTPREAEVLAWLAKGKTNRDIADILGMSPRTVNKHLEHIYIKMGVETRSAAAALVASHRLHSHEPAANTLYS
jgi:DNA-binding NarL/FixJ family response regulator